MSSYKIGTPVYYNYSNNNHTTQWRMIWHIYHHWYSNGCLFYKTTYEHTYAYMIYGIEMKRVWFSQYTVGLVGYICVNLLKLVCVQNNKITLRYIKFTDQTAICTRIDKQKRSTTRKHLVYLWQRNNSMMTCYTSFDNLYTILESSMEFYWRLLGQSHGVFELMISQKKNITKWVHLKNDDKLINI